MSRCTGHCCKAFYLPYTKAELEENARATAAGERADRNGRGRLYQAAEIAAMIIPLNRVPLDAMTPFCPASATPSAFDPAHYYTCRNLLPNGDCAIYETRPRMCRGFPYGMACPMVGCTRSDDDGDGLLCAIGT